MEEDGVPIATLSITPYTKGSVSQGALDFLEKQLGCYKTKASKQPEFKPFLDDLLIDMENIRLEMDSTTGHGGQ